ncbi:SET domain-containing protein [Phanerochaete sordida]|uniref:SET domain-containing protein n=1 Tax=Phanerochaete sordida TaxID=48140 RepID=A0A9P3LMD8_9APHY|nr:SET domain-containing protein [Phanerochaete sordida]
MLDDSPPDSPHFLEPDIAEDFAEEFADDFADADDNLISAEEGHSDLVYNTILNTYCETWAEFHSWDQATASEKLAGLAVPQSMAGAVEFDYAFETEEGSEDMVAQVFKDAKADDSLGIFTVCDWDADGRLEKSARPVLSRRGRRTRSRNTCFEEHASYEACAPSNSPIWSNDDLSICRHVKYGDDPKFNARGYLRQFAAIQWQQPTWRDLDMGLIAAKTIQKLTAWASEDPAFNKVQIFWDDIGAAGIIPMDLPAMLDRLKHRDCIGWPSNGFKSELEQLVPLWRSDNEPWMSSRVAGVLASFCPKAGCVQFECFNDPYPTGWTSGRMGTTELRNEELKARYRPRKPCGVDCFLTDNPDHQAPVGWDNNQNTHLLDEMLAAEPDAVPCIISQILLNEVPCYRVFSRREAKITISSADVNAARPRWSITTMSTQTPWLIPCLPDVIMKGRAIARIVAAFARAYTVNGTVSATSAVSNMRYGGCEHHGHGQATCSTRGDPSKRAPCDCVEMKWECHPMLCDCTKRRPLLIERTAEPMCKNVEIQRAKPAAIEVKAATYGMGAFAKQTIRRKEFLGEYVAELFPWRATYVSTIGEFLNKFGNNYAFSASKTVVADAANVGNETRFFNHAEDANVAADIKLVNGDHKVVFYATRNIKKGEEMLFNYGPGYWKRD